MQPDHIDVLTAAFQVLHKLIPQNERLLTNLDWVAWTEAHPDIHAEMMKRWYAHKHDPVQIGGIPFADAVNDLYQECKKLSAASIIRRRKEKLNKVDATA